MFPMELRKFVAPEFVFGIGARHEVGRYIKNLGAKNILVVTDEGIIKSGWAQDVINALLAEGLSFSIYEHISPNPRDHEVMEGVDFYKTHSCDALIAVGGGSVMDAAKGIGIVVSNGGHVLDYEGVDRVPVPMPPLICIPTTGGTSADVSQFAIINNTKEKIKIAIISKSVVPDLSLIDPECLLTMDAHLTACTGMDALVHAIEAFVSNASGPLTDLHALEAIRLIKEHLANSVADLHDIRSRTGVMLASLEAGLAFSNASLGCVHALAHSLGGFLDLPHGECNALLLPHVVAYNFQVVDDRYSRIGELLGLDFAGAVGKRKQNILQDYLIEMRTQLGIMGTLKNKGMQSTDVVTLASKAINDPCNATNPRGPSEKDLEVILREAL